MWNDSDMVSDQVELAKMLVEMGQTHLFDHWAMPGVEDEQKKGFFEQVRALHIYFIIQSRFFNRVEFIRPINVLWDFWGSIYDLWIVSLVGLQIVGRELSTFLMLGSCLKYSKEMD